MPLEYVSLDGGALGGAIVTERALKGFFTCMSSDVPLEVTHLLEGRPTTVGALEKWTPGAGSDVGPGSAPLADVS